MTYRFATERRDYATLASGQVFYSAPGFPAFPVRLASEVAQRCFALLAAAGGHDAYTLYDPCCGSGYLATILAFLHGSRIDAVYASDIDPQAVRLATYNLDLLTLAGLDRRIGEIESMVARFGKPSHREALAHAAAIRRQLATRTNTDAVRRTVFRADASDANALLGGIGSERIDLVVTDLPYGRQTAWQTERGNQPEMPTGSQLLAALRPTLRDHAIVAVVANREQAVRHPAYRRIDSLRLGKRQVTMLRRIA